MKDEISCIDRFVDILECRLMIMYWTILFERQMLRLYGLNWNNYILEKLRIIKCFYKSTINFEIYWLDMNDRSHEQYQIIFIIQLIYLKDNPFISQLYTHKTN